MKCPNCGSDIPDGSRFCDHCGAPINPNASIPTAEPLPSGVDYGSPEPEPVTPPSGPAYPPPPPASFGGFNPPSATPFDAIPQVVSPTQNSSMGTWALILGIVAVALSCVGCGGLVSIAGLITGYLSLKTSSRQMGIIGMILSGVGIIIAIIATFIIFAGILNGNSNSYSY